MNKTKTILVSWGRLHFSKIVATILISFHLLFLQYELNIPPCGRGRRVNSLPLEHAHTEYRGRDAMWLVKLDDKNGMHFHLVLLTHSFLESSCLTVRKPILAYEERLHGEEISLTRPQTSMEASNIPSLLCLVWIPDLQNHEYNKMISLHH